MVVEQEIFSRRPLMRCQASRYCQFFELALFALSIFNQNNPVSSHNLTVQRIVTHFG